MTPVTAAAVMADRPTSISAAFFHLAARFFSAAALSALSPGSGVSGGITSGGNGAVISGTVCSGAGVNSLSLSCMAYFMCTSIWG